MTPADEGIAAARADARRMEEAARHTPGPWFTDVFGHVYGWTEPKSIDGGTEKNSVCLVDNRYSAATRADKNLIAAAPDLLEALSRTLLELECVEAQVVGPQYAALRGYCREAANQAAAAIAKAEGR